MTDLQKRCLDISYRLKLSHLTSVLNTVGEIDRIYSGMKPDDRFVLGNSHAALALWVVLEKHGLCDAEVIARRDGTHAVRDLAHGIYVSGGSLGQAETVAVGIAIARFDCNVFLVTSDGSCAEGSVWESLNIASVLGLKNLHVSIIANGYGAYGPIDTGRLYTRLNTFFPCRMCYMDQDAYPIWLQGIRGHYTVLNEDQYKELMK